MTNRQKKREEIRKAIAAKYAAPSVVKTYKNYSRAFDMAKAKGWEFKEGAQEKYTKEEFEGTAALYATKAPGLVDVIAAENAVLEEQFRTSTTSIDQAVMLWKQHPELIAEYGEITREEFRANESFYFRELRSQYDDDASYDLAMSY
jgi:hypothetical protein